MTNYYKYIIFIPFMFNSICDCWKVSSRVTTIQEFFYCVVNKAIFLVCTL